MEGVPAAYGYCCGGYGIGVEGTGAADDAPNREYGTLGPELGIPKGAMGGGGGGWVWSGIGICWESGTATDGAA